MGDSLIEYFDWAERFPQYEVFNLGIAGETVRGLSARLGKILEKVKDPDFVFLMSGINSLAMGEDNISGTFRSIVRTLHQAFPSAQICIQSLLPVRFSSLDNEDIRNLNASLRHLAAEEGVCYLDLHTLFVDQEKRLIGRYLLEDGVHVSDEGYRIWAEEIEKLLASRSPD